MDLAQFISSPLTSVWSIVSDISTGFWQVGGGICRVHANSGFWLGW
jgi:hypothetical protein